MARGKPKRKAHNYKTIKDYDIVEDLKLSPEEMEIHLNSASARMVEILTFRFFHDIQQATGTLENCFKLIDVLSSFSDWSAGDAKRLLIKLFSIPWMKGSDLEFCTLYMRLNKGKTFSTLYKTFKVRKRTFRTAVHNEKTAPRNYPPKLKEKSETELCLNIMHSLEAFDSFGVSLYRARPKRLYLTNISWVRDNLVNNKRNQEDIKNAIDRQIFKYDDSFQIPRGRKLDSDTLRAIEESKNKHSGD